MKKNIFKKIGTVMLKTIEIILALVFILFEELIWENFVVPVKNTLDRFVREHVREIIRSLNKYFLLLIFLAILIVAEFLGVAAGYLFIRGFFLIGVAVYVVKIAMAGVTFWLFGEAKEKLNSIPAFRKGYDWVIAAKNWIEEREIYVRVKKRMKEMITKIRASLKGSGEFNRVYTKLKEIFKK